MSDIGTLIWCALIALFRSRAAVAALGCLHSPAVLNCTALTLETDGAAIPRSCEPVLPARPDQAVALRRRRIRDPLVARVDPLEFACGCARHRRRLRRAANPWDER